MRETIDGSIIIRRARRTQDLTRNFFLVYVPILHTASTPSKFPTAAFTASEIFYSRLMCISWKDKREREREREERVGGGGATDGKRAVYFKETALSFSCLGGARLLAHERWISKVASRVCNIVFAYCAPRLAHVRAPSSIVLELSNSLLVGEINLIKVHRQSSQMSIKNLSCKWIYININGIMKCARGWENVYPF